MSQTLKYDFVNDVSLVAAQGPTLTITRATTASVTDYNNVIKKVAAGEARFTGARRVENLCLQSADLSTTWSALNSGTVTGADQFNFVAENSELLQSISLPPKSKFTVSAVISSDTANTFSMELVDVADGSDSTVIYVTPTSTPTRYTLTADLTASTTFSGSGGIYFNRWSGSRSVTAGTSVTITDVQLENVSGQLDPSPSEYIPTTTAAVAVNYATRRRTNLAKQSQTFDNADWVSLATTVTANQYVAPDGTTTMDKLTASSGAAQHYLYDVPSVDVSVPDAYTFSVYIRYVNNQWIYLRTNAAYSAGASFDVLNGVIGHVTTGDTATIEEISPGLYRCSVTASLPTAVDSQVMILLQETNAGGAETWTAAGTEAIGIWGAQIERGATATAYIPTTTTVASSGFDTDITANRRRTNLLLQSETFDNASWLKSNEASTYNYTTAPDGTLTADRLLDNSATGTGQVYFRQSVTLSAATQYTGSIYLKADQLDWALLYMTGFSDLGTAYTYVDIGTGTLGSIGQPGTTAAITDAGNGWYRVSITFTTVADTTGEIGIYVCDANSDSTVDLDGTSSILVWGAQLEPGYEASTYIPTTTTAVSVGHGIGISGLLVEEARTNLQVYSQEFDNAAWTKESSTVVANVANAPDGTLTMDRLDVTAALGIHRVYDYQSSTVADATHCLSAFFKADGSDFPIMVWQNSVTENFIAATFNLANGTVGSTDVGTSSGTITDSGIEDVGNGIYRCWLTGSTSGTNGFFMIGVAESATPTYNAKGASRFTAVAGEDMLFWGADLQAGAFKTSYIPTVASSVTRNADYVSTTDMSWQTAGVGSFYIRFTMDISDSTTRYILMGDGSSRILYAGSGGLQNYDGTNIQSVINPYTDGVEYKYSVGYADVDPTRSAFINGSAAAVQDEPYVDTRWDMTALNVGSSGGGNSMQGHIAEIRGYNTRLTEAELEDLSNGIFPIDADGLAFVRDLSRDLLRDLVRSTVG
ncbi:MAG: phage head spike fiber domain-containing protein [Rhodospirillales bacterium]